MTTIERMVFAAMAVLLAINVASGSWLDLGSVNRDPDCPDDDYNGTAVYYPDYTNCSRYYECSDGEKISMSCPEGLDWDITNNTCNYPENVDCSHISTTIGPSTNATTATPSSATSESPISTNTTDSPGSSTTPTGLTESTTRVPTSTKAPGHLCEGIEDGRFISNPQDCSEYIQCVGGKEYFFKCPRDTYYDKKTGDCDSKSDDQC